MNYIGGSNTQTKPCGYWRYNEKLICERQKKKKKNSTREINTRIRSMFSHCKNLKIGRRSCFENEDNFRYLHFIE